MIAVIFDADHFSETVDFRNFINILIKADRSHFAFLRLISLAATRITRNPPLPRYSSAFKSKSSRSVFSSGVFFDGFVSYCYRCRI
jgi:hypothetical protein